MKYLVYAAFVAFWASVATLVLVAMLTAQQSSSEAPAAEHGPPPIPMAEVRRHASADDCWMVIDGGVYALEDYIPEHPTRPRVVTEWCGREATEAFRTKGYGRPHSGAARRELEDYRIGRLQE